MIKRVSAGLATAALLLALLPGSVLAVASGSVLDQSDTSTSSWEQNSDVRAQTFTAGLTGALTDVRLYLYGGGGSQTVTIYATSGDAPTGSVLATSGSLSVGGAIAWYDFGFTAPLLVTAGHQYAMVFGGSNLSVNEGGSDYAGGRSLYWNGTAWVTAPSTDFAFQTYVGPATVLQWDKTQVVGGESTPLTLTETFAFVGALPAVAGAQPNGATPFAIEQVALPSWFTPTGVVCSSQVLVAHCALGNLGAGGLMSVSPDGDLITVTVSGTASPATGDIGSDGTATAEGCTAAVIGTVVGPAQLPGATCLAGNAVIGVVAPGTTLPPTSVAESSPAPASGSPAWLLPAAALALFGAAWFARRRGSVRV
jgi:hypothetical protein